MTTKRLSGSLVGSLERKLLGGPLSFGEAVEALRIRDEITQVALANKIGISRQYLCDVEKGRRLVSPGQAARFAKAFGHPAHVLVQLALQDAVRAGGLNLRVAVEAA